MTKPSRLMSNGLEIPLVDKAVMLAKAAVLVGVMAASAEPAMTTSQRPVAISRAPLATLWVPAAQAVTVVSQGPRKP